MAIVAIEHLERKIGIWQLLEYINAAKHCREILFTNICSERLGRILSRYGRVDRRSVVEIFPPEKIIVLDPQADRLLRSWEARDKVLVVGGILGDDPPRGRTKKLLTDKYGLEARNLGDAQLTVDGAAYVACRIAEGLEYEDIRFSTDIVIGHKDWVLRLPYRYPYVNNQPLISPVIVRLLYHIDPIDDYWTRVLDECINID